LNPGDFLDFIVAPRIDTSYNSTSTGFDIQIAPAAVPEPTSIVLCAIGGSLIFVGRRFRVRNRSEG
jgi:hypothetical protein